MPKPSQEPTASSKALNKDSKDMPNPGQDPPAFSKAPNQDFEDMYVLGAFKIKIEGINLEHGSAKDPDHIQIKIKIANPSQ